MRHEIRSGGDREATYDGAALYDGELTERIYSLLFRPSLPLSPFCRRKGRIRSSGKKTTELAASRT